MCGITGIFDTIASPRHRPRRARAHERIAAPSRPGRGRRCTSSPASGSATGGCRSSICRPGQQPLFNEDGSVVVVFNGEIYNYQELIPELTALGHVFRTQSDTEVIVHAWEAWGERCVERFRGMFAFALWDRNRADAVPRARPARREAAVLRAAADGTLLFGSELKSLLAHGGLPREIDPFAVEEYFALGYVPEPRTIFRGARKLPPAHTLTIRRGAPAAGAARVLGRPLHARRHDRPRGGLRRTASTRLRESVRLRMISEVPLGAFLSGGVDSSAVVATMAGVSTEPGQHLLDRLRRPGLRRIARSRSMVADRYRTRPFRRHGSRATTST